MQRDDERETTTTAVLTDPCGPRWVRLLPHALGGVAFVLAIGLSWVDGTASWIAASMGVFLFAAARFLVLPLERFATQRVRLGFVPGAVEIRGGGFLRRTRLAARHVEGATTSRTKDGYRLTLRHAARTRPVAIEVRSLDQLQRLCRALGVGTRGYGSIAFPSRPSTLNVAESATRAVAALTALGLAVAVALGDEETAFTLVAVTVVAATVALLTMVDRLVSGPPTIRLDAHSVQLPATRAFPWIEYQAIESLSPSAGGLVARIRQGDGTHVLLLEAHRLPFVPEGMSDDEKALFHEIVTTAASRARGGGIALASHDDATLHLARRDDESPAAWLARLDALAMGPQAAYRGSALRNEDLVRVLEDTDASPRLRAAAARVLARNPGERRLRVAPVVAAEHDEAARVRIAAAIDGDDDEFLRLVEEDERTEAKAKRIPGR